MFLGNAMALGKIGDVHHWIGRCLDVQARGVVADGCFNEGRVRGIDVIEGETVLFAHLIEETDDASVEIFRAHHVIAGGEELEAGGHRSHARGKGTGIDALLQARDEFLEVLASRVLLSRVIKSGGLPQPNVSKGGRLIDGEADSLGFLMKSMRYMDTSGIKVIGHVQFSLSESRVSTRYVDMK